MLLRILFDVRNNITLRMHGNSVVFCPRNEKGGLSRLDQ
jgi:hypothetical protein